VQFILVNQLVQMFLSHVLNSAPGGPLFCSFKHTWTS